MTTPASDIPAYARHLKTSSTCPVFPDTRSQSTRSVEPRGRGTPAKKLVRISSIASVQTEESEHARTTGGQQNQSSNPSHHHKINPKETEEKERTLFRNKFLCFQRQDRKIGPDIIRVQTSPTVPPATLPKDQFGPGGWSKVKIMPSL